MRVAATDGSCRLDAPPGWHEIAADGAVLAVIEPPHGGSFRSNAVVTSDVAGPPDETLAEVARRQLPDLRAMLDGYRPVEVDVGRHEVRLRGLHHAHGVGLAVCQWIRRHGDGELLVLSVTVTALDLPAMTAAVDTLAASWRVTS